MISFDQADVVMPPYPKEVGLAVENALSGIHLFHVASKWMARRTSLVGWSCVSLAFRRQKRHLEFTASIWLSQTRDTKFDCRRADVQYIQWTDVKKVWKECVKELERAMSELNLSGNDDEEAQEIIVTFID
jgi:hypothetical protein